LLPVPFSGRSSLSDIAALTHTLAHRYRLERELGRGGMGTVYLARDTQLDRHVALKVLPPEFAEVPDLRERFLRETRLAAGFSHPNIVPVFAIEEHANVLAFAMGYVEGESLAARVAREGPLPQRELVRLLQDVAYALGYAHGRGVVHRDIKPDNIMLERATGRALVMDFGIARAITPVRDARGLTRVGEVVGTPQYMSPEQATGEPVDGRADLYSLGLVAWFALTGQVAMDGDTTQRILVRQLTEAVPPVASVRPDVPPALGAVVDRCCAKAAADRYPTAEALVEALDATQLAIPEVPVAVRLLVPDLTAVLVRAIVAIGLLAYGSYRLVGYGNASVFSFGLVALAMTWVRLVSTVQEVRRLRRAGFTVAELQRLMRLVQDERDAVRAHRRLDPVLVKRRRVRVVLASGILVWQVIVIVQLLQGRIKDGDANIEGRATVLLFFAALLASALATTALASSPFRRPFVEQLFSTGWLGRAGRAFLALVSGRPRESSSVATVTYQPSGPAPASRPGPGSSPTPALSRTAATAPTAAGTAAPTLTTLAADVSALRERVARLEQQRD
jgi:serine/threonine-protein kinase